MCVSQLHSVVAYIALGVRKGRPPSLWSEGVLVLHHCDKLPKTMREEEQFIWDHGFHSFVEWPPSQLAFRPVSGATSWWKCVME